MIDLILKFMFFSSFALIFHTYIAYPFSMFVMEKVIKRKGYKNDEGYLPSVSLMVAAFNEEGIIQKKIENSLELDYPREKLEFIFASDGSYDNTNDIISQYSNHGIKLIKIFPRRGKSNALNVSVEKAKGDILVFSDANSFLKKDVIKKLVRNFANPSVGCVSGELSFHDKTGNPLGIMESRFWNFETRLKRREGNIISILGANGGLYAIRKDLFKPLPTEDNIVDDFLITMNILRAGYLAICDPEAVGYEDTCTRMKDSFERKVRIGNGNLNTIRYFYPLLSPMYRLVSYALWSHKIIRWFTPFLLINILIANILLVGKSPIYLVTLGIQLLFYVSSGICLFLERKNIKIRWLYPFFYFLSLNVAGFFSFVRFITKTQRPYWKMSRQ